MSMKKYTQTYYQATKYSSTLVPVAKATNKTSLHALKQFANSTMFSLLSYRKNKSGIHYEKN